MPSKKDKRRAKIRKIRRRRELGLQTRSTAVADPPGQEQRRDLSTRSMQVRADTLDEQNRSVGIVLSTEAAVEVYDWRRGEVIEEILLADGVELPRQVPLLNTHSRWDLDDVLGSVREIEREQVDGLAALTGRAFYAEGDPDAERAWNKVRQGHLTDVSVGYRVTAYTDIEPNGKAVINGREHTAGRLRRRVAYQWKLREVSAVPIGADENAKTREDQLSQSRGESGMSKALRAYLERCGLRAEATDAEAWEYLGTLDGAQRSEAAQLLAAGDGAGEGSEGGRSDGEGTSTEGDGSQGGTEGGRSDGEGTSTEGTTEAGVALERARVQAITGMAGTDVPADLVQRAINEGWGEGQASREFLASVRAARQPAGDRAPAGHVADRSASVRSLSAGLLLQCGNEPVGRELHDGTRARRGQAITEQDAERGDQFASMSAMDLVRECAALDNAGRHYRDPQEAIRAAVSGTSLNAVFSTSVNAAVIAGWEEEPDSTVWCDVEDVADFKEQEDITLRATADLDKHPRGATAKHATMADDVETYKILRYSKQFVVDEQDLIDDRLGALMQMPRELGAAARRKRPDLVYSILLANAALNATSGALFNSTAESTSGGHANLITAVLGSAGLKAGLTAMKKHRMDGKVLNIAARYLLVPVDLEFTAMELLTAGRLIMAGDTDAVQPDVNVLQGMAMPVVDDRLGAAGVTDPITGTHYTGSATNWFLAAARRTVKVAYRRGTNRRPQLRSFALTQGQWGRGWDINLDIGAKAVDYRGLEKSAGTG